MTFHDLHLRLIGNLRQRVRSGEVTERRLAREAGVSQSHLHNVLKGKRTLSTNMADLILRHLCMDLLDLIGLDELHNRRQ